VNIRPYRDADESACRACIVERQDAERQFDARLRTGDEMADEYLEQMHTRCREWAGAILVAEQDDEVVGLTMVLARVPFESLDEPPGHSAWVAELVVRSGFRKRGIGTALLHSAQRHARDAGASELRIGVLSGNRPAAALYRREGFAPYSETLAKMLDGQ
jgi:ribosomal protein S18 acetylase RimI-like enzyme